MTFANLWTRKTCHYRSPRGLCEETSMPKVLLFGEDVGHAVVLQTFVERLAADGGVEIEIQVRRARGGHGRVLNELRDFVREFRREAQPLPDLLVIGRD